MSSPLDAPGVEVASNNYLFMSIHRCYPFVFIIYFIYIILSIVKLLLIFNEVLRWRLCILIYQDGSKNPIIFLYILLSVENAKQFPQNMNS